MRTGINLKQKHRVSKLAYIPHLLKRKPVKERKSVRQLSEPCCLWKKNSDNISKRKRYMTNTEVLKNP